MPNYDEFSGLDQVTHSTGALSEVQGGIPDPPRQHVGSPSLHSRTAEHNSLDFQSRSSRKTGTPPMYPGAVTAATPRPVAYHTPPGYGQTGPSAGPVNPFGGKLVGAQPGEESTGALSQARAHSEAASAYAQSAAMKRARGQHRDAAAHEQAARSHARAARTLATQGLSHQGASSMQPNLKNVDPDHYYEQPLGFVAAQIATTASGTATSKPQAVFRPTRLLVSDTVAKFFVITNIRIGTDSQLVGTTEMPAEVYGQTAVGAAFLLGTANIGIEISIDVRNTDTATQDFRAVLMGQTFK